MNVTNMITGGLALICLVLYVVRRRSRLRAEEE